MVDFNLNVLNVKIWPIESCVTCVSRAAFSRLRGTGGSGDENDYIKIKMLNSILSCLFCLVH